jgi:uncharacterized protein (TIGR03000 family)
VLLPQENARVSFNGHHMHKHGKVRFFQTPVLAQGKSYTYRISASWHHDGQTIHQERTVQVMAGSTVKVDFRPHGQSQGGR